MLRPCCSSRYDQISTFSKLYVASVPKIDRPQAEVKRQPVIKYSPAQMSNLKMLRDPIDGYTTVELPLTKDDQFEASLCHDRVCCNFTIDYELSAPITTQVMPTK